MVVRDVVIAFSKPNYEIPFKDVQAVIDVWFGSQGGGVGFVLINFLVKVAQMQADTKEVPSSEALKNLALDSKNAIQAGIFHVTVYRVVEILPLLEASEVIALLGGSENGEKDFRTSDLSAVVTLNYVCVIVKIDFDEISGEMVKVVLDNMASGKKIISDAFYVIQVPTEDQPILANYLA